VDYLNARYLAPAIDRFTSPDPLPITPQRLVEPYRLNRYAYAANNPLSFIDPTGLDFTCTIVRNGAGEDVGINCSEAISVAGELSPAMLAAIAWAHSIRMASSPVPGIRPACGEPWWLKNRGVRDELNRAWRESKPFGAISEKKEQAGWVMRSGSELYVRRVAAGSIARVDVPYPSLLKRLLSLTVVEGWFHTHPALPAEGYLARPSDADRELTNWARVPGVIKTHEGDKFICPAQ
jgi:RHS repeat-associated protein